VPLFNLPGISAGPEDEAGQTDLTSQSQLMITYRPITDWQRRR
jgi:hypothetical protein